MSIISLPSLGNFGTWFPGFNHFTEHSRQTLSPTLTPPPGHHLKASIPAQVALSDLCWVDFTEKAE